MELTFSATTTTDKKIYCGWSGEASKPLQPNSVFIHGANGKLDVLEMDPQFGLAVGLKDGQKVRKKGVLWKDRLVTLTWVMG